MTIFHALDYGLSQAEEQTISGSLESLLESMTEEEEAEEEEESENGDEGIEHDADDDDDDERRHSSSSSGQRLEEIIHVSIIVQKLSAEYISFLNVDEKRTKMFSNSSG